MADRERKGLVARLLEGKERSEDYARSTLPTNRWRLFWDILKGRFGRLMLINLLVFVTFLPVIGIFIWRYLSLVTQGMIGPFASGLMTGYPVIPNITGTAEYMVFQSDLIFFALFVPAALIAGLGISGGMYIIRNLIWTEGVFVANDFVRGIKRNFLNVMEAVLVFTFVLFLARTMGNLADWYVASGAPGKGWLIASKVMGYIFVAFFLLVSLWMISLGVNYKQGPWALFRNAIVMTIGTFPQTVLFAALSLWPFFLAVFAGFGNMLFIISIILLVLLAFSYSMLVWMNFSQWAFDRFINPNLGVATGRGLYNKQTGKMGGDTSATAANASDSAAMREYKRLIVAQGKSKLVCRPIKPIDDDVEMYQLPESFSREDLQKLKESRQAVEEDVRAYEAEHEKDERYVEYNRVFEERERALREEEAGGKKKKKKPSPPKMLTKRK